MRDRRYFAESSVCGWPKTLKSGSKRVDFVRHLAVLGAKMGAMQSFSDRSARLALLIRWQLVVQEAD
jgi:hypothetical protein